MKWSLKIYITVIFPTLPSHKKSLTILNICMASSVFLLFMSKVIYYQKFKVGTNLFIDGPNDKLILPVINRTQKCVTPIKE